MLKLLSIDTRQIKRFQDKNVVKVRIGNELLSAYHLLSNAILHSKVGFTQHLLIQDIIHHTRECLIFCMRGDAKMALVMLRISAEITRDILRLLEDPSREPLFLDGRKNKEKKNRREFVETFKFQLPEEDYLYQIYNLSSDFGVHGRIPLFDKLVFIVLK